MEPGPTSNTGGHERQREQTRSTRRSMALTTSQRGDLYRLARFGSEPEREEASRLLLEDATAHLARLRSTATDSTGTPRTPVHELVVQSAEKRLRDAEELFAATKTEAEDSEATIVLPQQQQQELDSVRKPAQYDAEFDEPQLGQDVSDKTQQTRDKSDAHKVQTEQVHTANSESQQQQQQQPQHNSSRQPVTQRELEFSEQETHHHLGNPTQQTRAPTDTHTVQTDKVRSENPPKTQRQQQQQSTANDENDDHGSDSDTSDTSLGPPSLTSSTDSETDGKRDTEMPSKIP